MIRKNKTIIPIFDKRSMGYILTDLFIYERFLFLNYFSYIHFTLKNQTNENRKRKKKIVDF